MSTAGCVFVLVDSMVVTSLMYSINRHIDISLLTVKFKIQPDSQINVKGLCTHIEQTTLNKLHMPGQSHLHGREGNY